MYVTLLLQCNINQSCICINFMSCDTCFTIRNQMHYCFICKNITLSQMIRTSVFGWRFEDQKDQNVRSITWILPFWAMIQQILGTDLLVDQICTLNSFWALRTVWLKFIGEKEQNRWFLTWIFQFSTKKKIKYTNRPVSGSNLYAQLCLCSENDHVEVYKEKKTKIPKIHVRFRKFPKNWNWVRNVSKSQRVAMSELGERSIWSWTPQRSSASEIWVQKFSKIRKILPYVL